MTGDASLDDPIGQKGSQSRRGFWIRTVVGIAISVVALWLVFRDVDLQSALEILRTADPFWVGVMFVAMLADIAVRTLRWKVILAPVAKVRYLRAAGYLTVGYAANNVLPARLGEFVRAHYVGDREGVSRAAALGTIVVERVVDFAVVVAIAAGALLILGIRGDVGTAVLIGAVIAVGLVAALVVGIFAHRLPGAAWVERQASRFPRLVGIAATFRAGLSVAGRPRTLVPAVVLTFLAWSITTVSFAAGGRAVGIEMSVSQAAFLAAGVSLVTAIPSGPGFVGTWELAAVKILAIYGVAGDTAVAFALLVHVSSLAITTVLGGISFLRLGWLPKAVPVEPATAAAAAAAPAPRGARAATPARDGRSGRRGAVDRGLTRAPGQSRRTPASTIGRTSPMSRSIVSTSYGAGISTMIVPKPTSIRARIASAMSAGVPSQSVSASSHSDSGVRLCAICAAQTRRASAALSRMTILHATERSISDSSRPTSAQCARSTSSLWRSVAGPPKRLQYVGVLRDGPERLLLPAAADDDREVRLDRPREADEVVDPVRPALVRHLVAVEDAADDPDRLVEPVEPLAVALPEVDPVGDVLELEPRAAEPEDRAAAAHVVERRRESSRRAPGCGTCSRRRGGRGGPARSPRPRR